MTQVTDFVNKLLDTSDWPARWHCGHWTAFHGWLSITSDLVIWAAYFAIPFIIIRYITSKTEARFLRLYFLFAAFILACGATHFLDALAFWVPVYRLNALVKAITGILSLLTVGYLLRLLPAAVSARTPADLENEIAQRKRAEEQVRVLNEQLLALVADKTRALVATEQRFGAIIENSYEAISLIDENYLPIYRNASSVKMMGAIDDGDLLKSAWVARTHPDDRPIIQHVFDQIKASPGTPVSCVFRTINAEGIMRWVECTMTNRLNNAYVKAIVSNFRDITERRAIEEELRKSEKIYKEMAAHLPGTIVTIVDKERRFIVVEGEGLQTLGYSKERMEGRPEAEVLHPDAYKIVTPSRDKAFKGENVTTEATVGDVHMLTRYVPLRDADREVYAVMTISIDITEIKAAQLEVKALNENLERKIAERTRQLEAVNNELESFSYSVSHDLRAPLRVIHGYAEILVTDHGPQLDDECLRLLKTIMNNTLRMGVLIDELLNLSRLGRQTLVLQPANMNHIVADVIEEQEIAGRKPLDIISVQPLMTVPCDAKLMRHVWSNLISNAVKYSSRQEQPDIRISSEQQGGDVIFSIKDNGVGFNMNYAQNLFGVFQRLHKRSDFEGTGVGLALAQRIVLKHNGKIWAEATEQQGATFYFSLPANDTTNGTI